MMNTDCVFCKIVAGEMPAYKVYEDADTLAFMDIAPIIKGHSLVIPKTHYDNIHETPEPVLQQVMPVVKKVAQAQIKALNADGVNIVQSNGESAGQVIPHIHFHVIPRFSNDGHSWKWNTTSYSGTDEILQISENIRRSIPQ